jgi:NifB/MoaA-like Fe-S oxidoreductase
VQTISIVPVGATMVAEERIERGEHADEVDGCTPEHARAVMALVAPYQKRFRKQHGKSLVYLADEYYLISGEEPPGAPHYDGFAQFENGIGMTRSLIDGWRKEQRRYAAAAIDAGGIGRISFVCATLIAPTLERIAPEFEALTGIKVRVHAMSNAFFGPRVNVSGLLVAQDLERQLRGRDLGDLAVLPRYALDYTGSRFLDDGTPSQLQEALGVPLAFASTLREVLQIVREPLESPVTGATVAEKTNGKAWVDFSQVEGGAPVAAR